MMSVTRQKNQEETLHLSGNDNDVLQQQSEFKSQPKSVKPTNQPTSQPNVPPPPRSVTKSHPSMPYRASLVHLDKQYVFDQRQLSYPKTTDQYRLPYWERKGGHYMAITGRRREEWPYIHTHQAIISNEVVTSKYFPANLGKTGCIEFSSDDCFSGFEQYPLPSKKAQAAKIGHGGVFTIYYDRKAYAVKKIVYRLWEIDVHSQLRHPNIVKLEAVLIGETHECHKDKHYVYCFMPMMDINFRNVLSNIEHGCLKHIKMQLLEKREQWELVLVNVKHVLKSVLKALDYMHSRGLVHRDVKASNILIKKTCQCADVLYCNCQERKFLVQIGDFDSLEKVPDQPRLEENQMIRYASVLPLGTMGYRAPEVSMHLVLSGPYEVLYTTSADIWSFGCLLLTIFIGKSGPLKQRGEASLLLSAQDHPYSQELYQNVIKIKEIQKYYANTSGVCDLVHKCLQVQPHCRPTAKELLQLDFFTS